MSTVKLKSGYVLLKILGPNCGLHDHMQMSVIVDVCHALKVGLSQNLTLFKRMFITSIGPRISFSFYGHICNIICYRILRHNDLQFTLSQTEKATK